jgi:hypothetical protein
MERFDKPTQIFLCAVRCGESQVTKLRTPDVVEFAVRPLVGQAVLACPPALN